MEGLKTFIDDESSGGDPTHLKKQRMPAYWPRE